MKKIYLLVIAILYGTGIFAQSPEAFKYQAVVRDLSGSVQASKNVLFRISIIQGTVTGNAVYSEIHSATTDSFGLVDLEIGRGTSPSGPFSSVAWGADISSGCAWSNVTNVSARATNSWNGKSNTDSIIAQPNHTSSAAKLCRNYQGGGFRDWYLPAYDELILLFSARYIIDKTLDLDGKTNTKGLSEADYWSSTEGGPMTAGAFMAGFHGAYPDVGKDASNRYVRAIRSF